MKTLEQLNQELIEEIKGCKNPSLPKSPFTGKEQQDWDEYQRRETETISRDNKPILSGTLE